MATVREDVVKVTFDVDDKPLEQVDNGIDKLVQNTQKMAGSSGVGGITKGFQSMANSVKKVAGSKLTAVTKSLTEMKTKLTEGEKGAKGVANAVKNVAKASLSKVVNGVKQLSTGLGSALKSAGQLAAKLGGITIKGLSAGLAGAAAGLGALGVSAINAYAEYEQLVGGVDTLFKNSSKQVQEYANNAYKTAGMSANDYMSTVTSFSASLLQSLGGDTEKAAKYADQAIIDMADNANKMGTDMESIQNAYQGFAKQNYTMLDNLKLGYGGTKEEMQRLLKDAEKITGKKYDLSNFADVTAAIHAIQTEMGITGTTSKEASSTIQGSALSMKAAWSNFLAGMANENADFDALVGNLIDSVVTFGENLIPRIQVLAPRLVKGLTQLGQAAADALPGVLTSLLPVIMDGAIQLVSALISTLQSNLPQLTSMATTMITQFATFLLQSVPQIIVVGIELLTSLITGIAQQVPQLVPLAMQAILTIAQSLMNNLPTILMAGIQILLALVQGLTQMLPTLIQMGIQLILSLITGLLQALPQLIGMIPQIFVAFIQGIFSVNWLEVGWNLIKAILGGVWEGAKSLVGGIWNGIKSLFSDNGEEAGTATGQSLTSGLQTSSTAATNELSAFAASTTDYGAQAATNMASGLTTNGVKITTAATDTMTNTNTAVQSGMDAVVSAVNSTDLKPSGVSVMQGLNSGMKSQIPALVATARSAAAAIKKATDVELDIHSPSKVMFESGANAGMGQVGGLRSTIPEMKIAAREVSNASIPYETYTPESSTYYSGGNSEYTTISPQFNLTISGTQDDRAMARRVKRYVAEAINDTFESLERKNYSLREA